MDFVMGLPMTFHRHNAIWVIVDQLTFLGAPMYQDMKRQYWWKGMKKDVASFMAKYMIFQSVKIEHQRPLGLLQSLKILE